jgi:signal transduction histidine kinase/ActR/RegA family two-component response regulator
MSERGAPDLARLWQAHWRTTLLGVVALLAVGVLGLLISSLGSATRERDRALQLQSHSYEVMILTRTLAGTMARAEASLSRYLISTDERLGQQYSQEWQLAGQQLDRLDAITGDNPTQQARMFALRQAYVARGEELSVIALSTRYKKNLQALARFHRARDSASLGQINELLDGFIASERQLLAERSGAAMVSIAQSNRAAKWFAGFGVLLVGGAIALGWITARAFTDRALAAAEAEDARERATEMEAAVAAATAELSAEAHEREAAEAKVRQMQKLEAIGQLTGGIAHDFNNMLAVVLGGLELAKRRILVGGTDVVRHIDSAAEAAQRASELTRRLLAFARSEPLSPQAVDVGALINGMSELLDRTLGDGMRIVVEDRSRGAAVWVDRNGLENSILNLAVNARDAMEGRGTLTIATSTVTFDAEQDGSGPVGEHVAVSVIDTGCGMDPAVIDRVFEPFFTTKPVGKGTGLGLSQIFGFVQQCKGEIGIASTPGEGTTVTIYLPRYAAALAQPGRSGVTPFRLEPVHGRRGYDILVVEDDPRVLAATVDTLHELGHRPVACDDPLDALRLALAMHRLDVIVSDVLMPGKTGPEMIADLRPRLGNVAVLFVTGYAGEASDHVEFGGHAVLRKPFTMAALEQAVERAVERRTSEPAPLRAAG